MFRSLRRVLLPSDAPWVVTSRRSTGKPESVALDVLDEVAASAILVAGFGHWRAEQTADIR